LDGDPAGENHRPDPADWGSVLKINRNLRIFASRLTLRLDCIADSRGLPNLYEGFGFALHSIVQKAATSYARHELSTAKL
jgi:hypothetical protein